VDGEMVDIYINITFGPTTGGGTGGLSFGLPYPAHPDWPEQLMHAKYYHSAGYNYDGYAWMAANAVIVTPHFPSSATDLHLRPWQGANAAGTPGTGIPAVSGQYTVTAGSNITVSGRYRKAP
jgi:hypothetical protein